MPGDLWPGQVRSFVEKRDHTYRAIRVRCTCPLSQALPRARLVMNLS